MLIRNVSRAFYLSTNTSILAILLPWVVNIGFSGLKKLILTAQDIKFERNLDCL